MKLIYQSLYPNSGYLFFRWLERAFEEEMKLKKEIAEVLQQASDRKKRTAN